MSFIDLILVLMVILFVLTYFPVSIVEKSPSRRFIGFRYDENKKVVLPPVWLVVLYSAFFLFFSGSYLYFWVKEMSTINYDFRKFLLDSFLFFGVAYFVTVPLIQKVLGMLFKKSDKISQ